MAKLQSRIFRFVPSASPDVVAYKVLVDLPGQVDYSSPAADVVDLSTDSDGKIRVDLAGLEIARSKDGIYDIGVVSVDDAGNESDIAILSDVNLDFVAPDAPTNLDLL